MSYSGINNSTQMINLHHFDTVEVYNLLAEHKNLSSPLSQYEGSREWDGRSAFGSRLSLPDSRYRSHTVVVGKARECCQSRLPTKCQDEHKATTQQTYIAFTLLKCTTTMVAAAFCAFEICINIRNGNLA